MKARGLHGVDFIVADDHAGLRAAIRKVVPEAAYQRCYVHFFEKRARPPAKKTQRPLPAEIALAFLSSTTFER
jgi:transposase-like protein